VRTRPFSELLWPGHRRIVQINGSISSGSQMFPVRRHQSDSNPLRTAIAAAMVPLVLLNASPVPAGCICADGHREAICQAARCRDNPSDCGCQCCAVRGRSSTEPCCTQHSNVPDEAGLKVGGTACTPLVHQAVPSIIPSAPMIDAYQLTALLVTPVGVPTQIDSIRIVHRVDFDIGRPSNDLVITFQRLVI
jgi:hypothetical protein